jgi:hypothetical protein
VVRPRVGAQRDGHGQAAGYKSIGFPLIGAGSGGGKAARVQGWMEEELRAIEYDGDVVIVRYKPPS